MNNLKFGMSSEEYKMTIEIIQAKGIQTLSNSSLVSFFEQILINLTNSYGY